MEATRKPPGPLSGIECHPNVAAGDREKLGKSDQCLLLGDTIPAMTRARAVLRWRALRRTLCLIAFIALLSVELPARATVLTVSTTADAVNGDTSSPDALIANPGPDGISLREAMTAANNAPGPHVITFAQTLAGSTLALASPLPPISRDQVTLTGLTTGDGQPNITIDASHATGMGPTIWVGASSFTMTGMRFVFIPRDHAVQIGGALPGSSRRHKGSPTSTSDGTPSVTPQARPTDSRSASDTPG